MWILKLIDIKNRSNAVEQLFRFCCNLFGNCKIFIVLGSCSSTNTEEWRVTCFLMYYVSPIKSWFIPNTHVQAADKFWLSPFYLCVHICRSIYRWNQSALWCRWTMSDFSTLELAGVAIALDEEKRERGRNKAYLNMKRHT